MTTHSSASPRKQEPHVITKSRTSASRTNSSRANGSRTRTSRTNTSRANSSRTNGSRARTSRTNTILNALTRRTHAILNDESIDADSRAIIRHALEVNDPWLAKLVKRAEAGEIIRNPNETISNANGTISNANGTVNNANGFSKTSEVLNRDSSAEKAEALAEMICRSGEESSAALFVLMATLQDATDPQALAHSLNHFAFTRCGEFNFGGMVDTQVPVLERYLFSGNAIET